MNEGHVFFRRWPSSGLGDQMDAEIRWAQARSFCLLRTVDVHSSWEYIFQVFQREATACAGRVKEAAWVLEMIAAHPKMISVLSLCHRAFDYHREHPTHASAAFYAVCGSTDGNDTLDSIASKFRKPRELGHETAALEVVRWQCDVVSDLETRIKSTRTDEGDRYEALKKHRRREVEILKNDVEALYKIASGSPASLVDVTYSLGWAPGRAHLLQFLGITKFPGDADNVLCMAAAEHGLEAVWHWSFSVIGKGSAVNQRLLADNLIRLCMLVTPAVTQEIAIRLNKYGLQVPRIVNMFMDAIPDMQAFRTRFFVDSEKGSVVWDTIAANRDYCRDAAVAWCLCAKSMRLYKDLRALLAKYIWGLRFETITIRTGPSLKRQKK